MTSFNSPSAAEISRRRVLQVGAAGAALSAAPFAMNLARAQTGPIRIGFPTPLTGAFSAEAQDQVRAAELAVKEFNDAGGYNGRKVELLVRDCLLYTSPSPRDS